MKSKELIIGNMERMAIVVGLAFKEAEKMDDRNAMEYKRWFQLAGVADDVRKALEWVLEDGEEDIVL